MSRSALLGLVLLGSFFFPSLSLAQTAKTHFAEHTSRDMPEVVWLRPPEVGLTIEGVTIVDGPLFENMVFLASHLPQYSHRFEAYPVKRAWSLIENSATQETVYCFFGASYRKERTSWGYFSSPTSISLPMLVATSKALSNKLSKDSADDQSASQSVSLQSLLDANYRTVLYSEVQNAYVDAVKQWAKTSSIVQINGLEKDLGVHTVDLIETGRIDFGYVGHRELMTLNEKELGLISVFRIEELSQETRLTKRLFCSKSEQGKQVINDFDTAMQNLKDDVVQSLALRDINFVADGYPPMLKPLFDERWRVMQTSERQQSEKLGH